MKQIRESIMLHFYEQPVVSESQISEENNHQEAGVKRKIDDSSADTMLPKRIQFDDVASVKLLTRPPSANISTPKDEDLVLSKDDLLDLDASQFEENSKDNELFSMENPSFEILENTAEEDFQVEKNMFESVIENTECQMEKNVFNSVDESSENTQLLSFNIPFESISENGNVISALPENRIADNSANCNNNQNFLNKNESLGNEFEFNLSLPENSFQDLKKDFFTNNDNKISSTSDKVLNQTTLSQWSKGLIDIGGNMVEVRYNLYLLRVVSDICRHYCDLKNSQGSAVIANALNARLTKRTDEGARKSEKRPKSNGMKIFTFQNFSISSIAFPANFRLV